MTQNSVVQRLYRSMESAKQYFKEEFKVKMFFLEHPDCSDFTLSCWQRNRQSLPLLLWRVFLFISSLTIMISSMITYMLASIFQYWFIYLTHWGLTFIVLMSAFGTGISAHCYIKGPTNTELYLPWYVKVYWVLYNIAVPLAILITIFYWSILYEAGVQEEMNLALDIAVHGLNTVIVLMMLFTCRQPVRLLHFYHTITAAVVYMLFGVLYYLAGGTDQNGNPWIYSVINWQAPGPTILILFMTGFMLLLLHFVVALLATFRDSLVNKMLQTDKQTDTEMPEAVPFRRGENSNV